jgi:dienelactone hydrolase
VLLGGAIGFGFRQGFRRPLAIIWLVCATLTGAATLYWLVNPGQDAPVVSSLGQSQFDAALGNIANPGLPGPFQVHTLNYGSATDQRRAEYGPEADVHTRTVDGTAFLAGWEGLKGRLRSWYWGFGPEALPLNARVWYPEGEGPFALVLIVHGNHRMFDYSDPGYAYLGEHLASQGFIVASVDQNFLNGSLYGELEGENSARGWHLLQHLALWREWNESTGHILAGKVDMENIALVGHSRGGEAAVLAAAYNSLPHYPGDADQRFDFGFSIRSLVGIAPVDGQYNPADRPAPVAGVNYLLLTGVHDADVSDLSGGRVFDRVQLSGGPEQFKAALHIYGANHGQFNTVWGNRDFPAPFHWLLNTRPLLTGDEQRQITKLYLSAFLEATLRNEAAYRPLFRDHRVAAAWLPPTLYVSQYRDASHQSVARFDEDLDLSTTTVPGGLITGRNLAAWREEALPTPYNTATNFGAYLAWDETVPRDPASFSIALPEGIAAEWQIGEASTLVLSLADGREPGEAGEPIDFTVRLAFEDGGTAEILLSQVGTLWPAPAVKRFKVGPLEALLVGDPVLLQRFELPLASFAAQAGSPLHALRSIELVFDVTPEGALHIDEVGFADLRWPTVPR